MLECCSNSPLDSESLRATAGFSIRFFWSFLFDIEGSCLLSQNRLPRVRVTLTRRRHPLQTSNQPLAGVKKEGVLSLFFFARYQFRQLSIEHALLQPRSAPEHALKNETCVTVLSAMFRTLLHIVQANTSLRRRTHKNRSTERPCGGRPGEAQSSSLSPVPPHTLFLGGSLFSSTKCP